MLRRLHRTPALLVATLGLGLLACEPKEFAIKVKLITSSCQAPPPLEGVRFLRVRVFGEGIETPLEAVSPVDPVGEVRELSIPEIPAGEGRYLEVRAYTDHPANGARVVSMGRSLTFDVPNPIREDYRSIEVNVFLRQVDRFTSPSAANSPVSCAAMLAPRAGHTATLLSDGRVLILGGYQLQGGKRVATERAEIFNPGTGAFEQAPSMGITTATGYFSPLARAFQTATLLNNGQVLLWGGELYNNDAPVPSPVVLVFDPVGMEYGALPTTKLPNQIARSQHAAVLDRNGKVLIVGGLRSNDGTLADQVEWYDPDTGEGKLVEGVSLPRRGMSAASVQEGRFVAVAGGVDGTGFRDEIEFFTFDQNNFIRWQTTPTLRLNYARRAAGVAPIRGGAGLIVAGGYTDPSAVRPIASMEVVNTGDSFNVGQGPAINPRGDICSALLKDGRVMTIGGRTVEPTGTPPRSSDKVELVTPQEQGGVAVRGLEPPVRWHRHHHTCTTMADGSVLVLGGVREELSGGTVVQTVLQDAWIYTPEPLD